MNYKFGHTKLISKSKKWKGGIPASTPESGTSVQVRKESVKKSRQCAEEKPHTYGSVQVSRHKGKEKSEVLTQTSLNESNLRFLLINFQYSKAATSVTSKKFINVNINIGLLQDERRADML